MAGGGKRKRQQQTQETQNGAKNKKQHKSAELSAADEKAIDAELKKVNDMLQKEETSQKQTWQIGKRLKKLMETYPAMTTQKTIDAFFLWGTALARLASLNEDPTLAEAAADKFQEMHEISGGDDSAMGPVGYSLWASSLLIVATETRQKEVLDQALGKFAQAVEVDGGTTFETRFQYAKALKDGGDLVKFLESEEDEEDDGEGKNSYVDYYRRALKLCEKLEEIYEEESAKAEGQEGEPKPEIATKAKQDNGENDDDEDEEDEEEEEDDDKVFVEDFAEVKLLEAILHGVIENEESKAASFHKTLSLFEKALEISPESPDALMELANYVSKKFLEHRAKLKSVNWEKVFFDIEAQYKQVLLEAGFDMAECHEICVRKDTKQQEEPEEEDIDERVPHLLNSLGKALASFAVGQKQEQPAATVGSGKKKQTAAAMYTKSPHFVHAVEVLRAAHHFHDKLGCYPLAWLYAYPGIEDEENCRTWLETAESYGVLDDELQLSEFHTMHDKDWFQKFLTPAEEIDEDEMEGEGEGDGEEEGEEGSEDDEAEEDDEDGESAEEE